MQFVEIPCCDTRLLEQNVKTNLRTNFFVLVIEFIRLSLRQCKLGSILMITYLFYFCLFVSFYVMIHAGKSLSEALIFASTDPQYDDRLFIELQVQYMKIPSSNLGRTCVQKLFLTFRTIFVHNMFSPCSAKRKASDKNLPVMTRIEC